MATVSLSDPASSCVAVDITSTDHTFPRPAVIRVGTAGDLAILPLEGSAVTITNVQAGEIIPVRCLKVLKTGTTASNPV